MTGLDQITAMNIVLERIKDDQFIYYLLEL